MRVHGLIIRVDGLIMRVHGLIIRVHGRDTRLPLSVFHICQVMLDSLNMSIIMT